MGKIFFKIIFILLVLYFFPFNHGCFQRKKIYRDNLVVLQLSGKPYDRGFIHGKYLKKEIDIVLQKWKREVEVRYEIKFDSIIDIFFKETDYISSINCYCPDLLEEVRGIADGANQNYKLLLAFQMSEELEANGKRFINSKCTSLSTSKTDQLPTVIAQNMDPPIFLHGFPLLLHITDKGRDTYVYTVPGLIGLCGMSNRVAIACNGISMLNCKKKGLPVAYIVRKVLTLPNEQEAFSFIQKVSHAVPQAYTIGGKFVARCYECSANKVVEFKPFDNNRVTLHTNFAAVNRDFNLNYIEILSNYGKTIDDPYFCPRYFIAYEFIEEMNFYLSTENIKRILSSKVPNVNPISNDRTYGCLIMSYDIEPILYLSAGRPDSSLFFTFSLNR